MTEQTYAQPFTLARAQKIAAKVLHELVPFCLEGHIEIAGSIRRQRPYVNDIDIVCLPNDEAALRERVMRVCLPQRANGDQNLLVKLPLPNNESIPLDLWIARPAKPGLFEVEPSNYGTLLVCRTGSKEFNIYLADQARRINLHWNPYRGVMRGDEVLAAETESQVFKALKMDFVKPEMRERT